MAHYQTPSAAPLPDDDAAQSPSPETVQTVAALRRRARHRLIGASILVALAIVILPMLLDAPPRPVSPAIPITVGDQLDIATAPAPTPATAPAVIDAHNSLGEGEEVIDTPATAPTPEPSLAGKAIQSATNIVAAVTVPPVMRDKTQTPPATPTRPQDDAQQKQRAAAQAAAEKRQQAERDARQKAQAKAREDKARQDKAREDARLAAAARAESRRKAQQAQLDATIAERTRTDSGKTPPVVYNFPETGRFVVQIGPSVAPDKVAAVRRKLSAAGLRNYTQIVKIDGKDATRVRMGPYKTRREMEQVAAKVKALGLPVSLYSY